LIALVMASFVEPLITKVVLWSVGFVVASAITILWVPLERIE
jgi:hypothetical protein